jgi:hypothetical protein
MMMLDMGSWAEMLSGAIHGRLSRYFMFHQACSVPVQDKTGTGIS